jgi:hypothetical protein
MFIDSSFLLFCIGAEKWINRYPANTFYPEWKSRCTKLGQRYPTDKNALLYPLVKFIRDLAASSLIVYPADKLEVWWQNNIISDERDCDCNRNGQIPFRSPFLTINQHGKFICELCWDTPSTPTQAIVSA